MFSAGAEGGESKENDEAVTGALDLESNVELAKKLGIPSAFAVGVGPAGSVKGCDTEKEGAVLGGASAICGTAASIGVGGAGANTAILSAAKVTGGLEALAGFAKLVGRGRGPDFCAAPEAAPNNEELPAVSAGAGFVKENGRLEIGGSLAFAELNRIG